MGRNVEYPVIVNVDNAGAIFLANNTSVLQRTKHIHTRVHFVRQYMDEGIVKIIFVRTVNSLADLFTKNREFEDFQRLTSVYLVGQEDDAMDG